MKLLSPHSKIVFFISRMTRRIWFRTFAYAIIGIGTAFVAYFARGWLPENHLFTIGSDAVGNILTILASSMLAVATFSLSIMVTAFGNASTGATPRATRLLMENQRAQAAVSTFIGAFLFSIVGLIALTSGLYGRDGRVILFVVTIVVIVVIVATLIGWVDQLASLGRVSNTIEEVENAGATSLREWVTSRQLGGRPCGPATQEAFKGTVVTSPEVGFVAFIEMPTLQDICEKNGVEILLEVIPGSFNYPGRKLARFNATVRPELVKLVASAFVIDKKRTFQQDPRFAFVLLSEIASRALSPAVNDPGTAIEVLGAAVRLLTGYANSQRERDANEARDGGGKPEFNKVFVPEIATDDLFGSLILPIARDGAAVVEIAIRIQKSLRYLEEYDEIFRESTKLYARIALDYAMSRLSLQYEKELLCRNCGSVESNS